MPKDVLSEIKITNNDIDKIEQKMEVEFDNQRREIIKNMDDLIVQAFPGTGKTTVLIAKLAILGEKWPYNNRGICVISHTNVAREEIEQRLGSFGRRLLMYPNFIGTMHSFFDTFVALPWLRSNGYKIRMIDTESVLTHRYCYLPPVAKPYFKNHKSLDKYTCKTLTFPQISVKIDCGEETKSYKAICGLISDSIKEGYYTFDETLVISKYVLECCKFLPAAIQTRFPLVLIDESQDTSDTLWELINNVFSNGTSKIQIFGDSNQAIFQSPGDGGTTGSRPESIIKNATKKPISNSYRFGDKIAHLANSLGVEKGLVGYSTKFKRLDDKHMIFLFDDAKKVLPAYAKHLLSCFSDGELNSGYPCYAVGMVHNKKSLQSSAKNYPTSVRDYYPEYNPGASSVSYEPQNMFEFFWKGRAEIGHNGNFYLLVESVARGLKKYIILKEPDLDISVSASAFRSLLHVVPEQKQDSFRQVLFSLCNCQIKNANEWSKVLTIIGTILDRYFNIGEAATNDDFFHYPDANEFLKQKDPPNLAAEQNVFTYQEDGRTVNIKLSSIHAVKGMTHLATLVLDTFWFTRNIKALLPWMCERNKKPEGNDFKRLRCHYVALTRASALVCIAIPKYSIKKKDLEDLKNAGWNITEV